MEFEAGEFSGEVHEPQNGRWLYDFVTAELKGNDTLDAWIQVEHDSDIYKEKFEALAACDLGGNYLPVDCHKTADDTTVKVETLAKGFRVSIPDNSVAKRIVFNVNRNQYFKDFVTGELSGEVHKSQNGRWQYDFVNATLRANDTLFLWLEEENDNGIYKDEFEPLQACDLAGNNLPDDCPKKADETIDSHNQVNYRGTTPTHMSCQSSETETSPAIATLCKGQLIFEENFDQLNETRWQHEVRTPSDITDVEFLLYDGKARVRDGQLIIEPQLWSSYRPDLDITNAKLDLSERCTGIHNRQKECVLRTGGTFIMPPVVVPRISTVDSFQFKYGRIEIRAKLPKGDWLVPLLLLEPYREYYGQTGYESGQLRVAMARGNDHLRLPHGKLIDGRTLLAGPVLSTEASQREDFMVPLRRNVHFGNDFHVYGLEWSSQSFRFTIDGKEYGELSSIFADSHSNAGWRRGGPLAPFDRMFYISVGLSVGGFGDFVDNLTTATYEKPWSNKNPRAMLHFWQRQNDWLPSWKQPNLLVDYVRVFAI
ncbi:gram-negative bacteria-binding protein 1-like [Drosophila innubila]|uniref:gram-negative bacteria-binding protein 1-like n=1 Tax=Drosophila innubila TaxID=198719 RepID=UPI00148BFB21|nr:gram-negative bacteria-binding protein 1-like [Drosophila innubila]